MKYYAVIDTNVLVCISNVKMELRSRKCNGACFRRTNHTGI